MTLGERRLHIVECYTDLGLICIREGAVVLCCVVRIEWNGME